MSKKKFSTGSMTMTLKDFHGGSIPSDLVLPSAPGISSRPHDRPSAWIASPNPSGASTAPRADHHRPRPGSSGGIPRVLDERGPSFLSSPSFIGRHFDEDERKPFDSSSAPRRQSIVAAEPTRAQPISASQASARSDLKRPVSSPVVAQHLSPSRGVSTSSAGNAWAARKEARGVVTEPPQTHLSVTFSRPAAASRFAQASAIEKVSSGRWQSKPLDVEVIRFLDVGDLDRRTEESVPIWNDEEGNLGMISSYSGVKEMKLGALYSDGFLQQERVISTPYPEIKEINIFGYKSDLSHPVFHEGRVAASQHQHTLDEALERPKLKLLPRTKPLEPSDTKLLEDKQGHLYPTSLMHMEEPQEMCRTVGKIPGSVGADAVSRPAERPKLNLKPRSQPIEKRDENSEKERKTVFGGARPREFVLKERAVDATDNLGIAAESNWVKPDVLKIESKLESAASFNRQVEEVESSPAEHTSARNAECKDNLSNHEKGDGQRNSWRNENRRNPKEMEKKPVERLQEHETWLKPIQPPKPETPPGPRAMRAASALELAQAFSRSMSDSRVDNLYTNQRVLPGRTQIPFSRLTDTREIYSGSTHRHINGY